MADLEDGNGSAGDEKWLFLEEGSGSAADEIADLGEGVVSAGSEKWLICRKDLAQLEMRNGCSRGGKWISWR
jgi:hypothetical protein